MHPKMATFLQLQSFCVDVTIILLPVELNRTGMARGYPQLSALFPRFVGCTALISGVSNSNFSEDQRKIYKVNKGRIMTTRDRLCR